MSAEKEKNLSELLDTWCSGVPLTDDELLQLHKSADSMISLLDKSGHLFKLPLGAMR